MKIYLHEPLFKSESQTRTIFTSKRAIRIEASLWTQTEHVFVFKHFAKTVRNTENRPSTDSQSNR